MLDRIIIGSVCCIAMALGSCEAPVIQIVEPPVRIVDESPGTGREARRGNLVSIDYEIRLPDGREVLRARNYEFELGRGVVIVGVDRAVEGMRMGGRRTVEVPPHLHWGRQGYGDIPPNTTLTIELRLARVR